MISERTKRKKVQSKYSKGEGEDDEYDLEKLMKIANGQQMDDDEEKLTLYRIKMFRKEGAGGRFVHAEFMVDVDDDNSDATLEVGALRASINGRRKGSKK